MEGAKWIIFAFCVVSCGAHFGYPHHGSQNRRISISPRNSFQHDYPNLDDHKCSTIARRTFHTTQLLGYPCERKLPGMPVVRTVYGPTGLICQSYFKLPAIRYYRISTCCPGWTMDRAGSCSIRKTSRLGPPRSPMGMMLMRKMMYGPRRRMTMWHGIQNLMATRDAMQYGRGLRHNTPTPSTMSPFTPNRRPGFVTLLKNLKQNPFSRQFGPRKIALIRIQRPDERPPMPHPLQKPPVTSRMIRIIKNNPTQNSGLSFPLRPQRRFPMIPSPKPQFPHIPPRRPDSPPMFRRMFNKPRYPSYPQINRFPEFPSRYPQIPPIRKSSTRQSLFKFPQIPTPRYPSMSTSSFPQNSLNTFPQISSPRIPSMTPTFPRPLDKSKNFPEIPANTQAPVREAVMSGKPDPLMRIDLPVFPLEQPDPVVEKTPMPFQEEEEQQTPSCLEALTVTMKNCLANSGVDVPDIMAPFNDPDRSAIQKICSSQDVINQCMEASVAECRQGPETAAAQDMMTRTMETFNDMCAMQEGNVDFPEEEPMATRKEVAAKKPAIAKSHTDLDKGDDAEASSLLHAASKLPQQPVETEKIDPEVNAAEKFHKSVHQAIKHEVQAEEVRVKEFYLPLLIGTAVGFVILVLIMSLLICCCCKRRLKQKMKMSKEPEKPGPLKGIYTIGVPPPVYEVNGIPPLYYEEAKGEKISAKDYPAVIESKDITEDTTVPGENTQM